MAKIQEASFVKAGFVATNVVFDHCYDCGASMTPHEGIGSLAAGDVTDEGDVWCRCTGCGGRGGFRPVA